MATQVGYQAEEHQPAPRVVRFDTEALYMVVDRRRRELRISNREVLRQIGEHTPSSLTRLGQGRQPSTDLLVRLLHWLGETDVAPYIAPVESGESA
jgi:hypothetical protein